MDAHLCSAARRRRDAAPSSRRCIRSGFGAAVARRQDERSVPRITLWNHSHWPRDRLHTLCDGVRRAGASMLRSPPAAARRRASIRTHAAPEPQSACLQAGRARQRPRQPTRGAITRLQLVTGRWERPRRVVGRAARRAGNAQNLASSPRRRARSEAAGGRAESVHPLHTSAGPDAHVEIPASSARIATAAASGAARAQRCAPSRAG